MVETLKQANQGLGRIAQRIVERVEDIEAQEDEYTAIQRILDPYKRIGDLLMAQKMGWKVKDFVLRSLAITLEAEAPEMLNKSHKDKLSPSSDHTRRSAYFSLAVRVPTDSFPT